MQPIIAWGDDRLHVAPVPSLHLGGAFSMRLTPTGTWSSTFGVNAFCDLQGPGETHGDGSINLESILRGM